MRRPLAVSAVVAVVLVGCAAPDSPASRAPSTATPDATREPAEALNGEGHEPSEEAATLWPAAPEELVECLPPGRTEVELITPDPPPRVREISRKLIPALQRNSGKVQRLLAEHPDPPLPYRRWMGVSRAEYDEYLRLSEQKWGLLTLGTETVVVETADDAATFRAAGVLEPLDGVRLTMDDLAVHTGGEVLTDPETVRSDGAAGFLQGFRWSKDADAVTLAIARIRGTEQCYLDFGPGQPTEMGSRLMIRYPMAGAS